ncbi:uncharacterized protein LOC123293074 [Chrysoperla carnea]|uniref:uncharacterized protein LOC123293074 n=1 Tax=Chrysoperla carnea TaxID=189513 RepID=UPI001D064DCA|nr:uncharacterized protein LOC123293074 [Chrysoperla carnea]
MDRVRITYENPDTSSDKKPELIHENDKNSITINCENNIKMEKQLNTEFIIKEEILEDIDVNMESGHIEEGLEHSFIMEPGGRIKNEVLNDCYSLECIPTKNEKLENSTTLINYENIKLEKQLNTDRFEMFVQYITSEPRPMRRRVTKHSHIQSDKFLLNSASYNLTLFKMFN